MSDPIEFAFTLEDGRKVTAKADAYTSGDPSVGLFGPYYEEVWAEDSDGNQIELSEVDSDRVFQAAAQIAAEGGDEP